MTNKNSNQEDIDIDSSNLKECLIFALSRINSSVFESTRYRDHIEKIRYAKSGFSNLWSKSFGEF